MAGIDSAGGVQTLHQFKFNGIDATRLGRRSDQQGRCGTSRGFLVGGGGRDGKYEESRSVQITGSLDRIVKFLMDFLDRGSRFEDAHPAESDAQYLGRGLDRGGSGESSVSPGAVRKDEVGERIINQGLDSRENGFGIDDERRIERSPRQTRSNASGKIFSERDRGSVEPLVDPVDRILSRPDRGVLDRSSFDSGRGRVRASRLTSGDHAGEDQGQHDEVRHHQRSEPA